VPLCTSKNVVLLLPAKPLKKALSLSGVWIQIAPSFRIRGVIRGTIITVTDQHKTNQQLFFYQKIITYAFPGKAKE
jgi:hypothetical protein